MSAGAELFARLWRAARLRRAGLWLAGALPWLLLRSGPGLLAWSAFCAWDALRLQRLVAHGWTAWLDGALPEMEDSAALLLTAESPVAQLQRERLLARIASGLAPARVRAIVRARVPLGLSWLAADLALAALAWGAPLLPHSARPQAAVVAGAKAVTTAAAVAELVVKMTPPRYTGVEASSSAPRDLQAPEQTTVEWCLKNPAAALETVELSDGEVLHAGTACARWTATESIFWRWRGARYTLKVLPDQAPEIVVSQPNEIIKELARDATQAAMAISVRDDYQVKQATLHLTLARGSGENIRFSDREMPIPGAHDPRRRDWARNWTVTELGMEPGDELYFFVRATDNAARPHTVQSPTYTLRLPAPKQEDDQEVSALPVMVKPESLRSQRQIIIDTEQLIADMRIKKMDVATMRERSESIAADQGALRRRYGQFLGEESTLFGKDDHDDHGGSNKPVDVLHEFGHAHDQAENATLFDDATKKVLRRALSAMWDAENALRAITPKTALPPEHKALEAIKELQQSERIYLHKTAFAPPPIKEDKRMSGDMADTTNGRREQSAAPDGVPAQLRELVGALTGDGPLPSLWTRTAHDWVRERIVADEQRLAAQRAIQDVADGCLACRPVLRAWLRGAVHDAPVLLQATTKVETPFDRAAARRRAMNALHIGLAIAALVVGVLSALAYAVRRRWIDALLAALAGVALAGAVGSFTLPGDAGATLRLASSAPPASLDGVRSLALDGDGLRAAAWNDLPARPLAWTAPATPTLRLAFPRSIALGRMFTLSLERSWKAPGRLQLLAENGEVLAESKGEGTLSVQWLPPLAERLVLKARLLDANGKLVDQGPVPVTVTEPSPLQVRGRFGAPSFDLRTLNDLLAASNAVIDWQVELGKNLRRSESAREAMKAPDLEIVDAAWFERAGDAGRAALLARVADGAPLLVLGANAGDAGVWSRSIGLHLAPQPADKTIGTRLTMASGGLNPAQHRAGEWQGEDGVWTRDWRQGRIAWLGMGGWHRHAIEEPRALALWWQDVLDRLQVRRKIDVAWLDPQELPLPDQRLEICARGDALAKDGEVNVPALVLTLGWQRRAEYVDASCVAVWPKQPGWLNVRAQAPGGRAADSAVYVYADADWALWQRAQRRDATARYAARTPAPVTGGAARTLPAWPFGLVFALAMLGLWWRERR
jgi:hypothetical protein